MMPVSTLIGFIHRRHRLREPVGGYRRALPPDRQRKQAELLMVDFDLGAVGGGHGFELRPEVCGDEDESLVFFQADMM
jgi:hypothetical protein